MRSSSRNSREYSSALGLVAAVSLLLGSAAQAGEHNFVLTAYSNGKGGSALLTGNYDAAGKELQFHPTLSASDGSTNSNNRCVAFAKTKQFEAARAACDKAVREAEHEKSALPSYQYWARSLENDYVAVALSNRAVLHWMTSDSEAAAADLKRAEELSPKSAFVMRNKSALEYSQTTVARADVASK